MAGEVNFYKVLKSALSNPTQVIAGIANSVRAEYGYMDEEDIELIAKRRQSCFECPYYSENARENPGPYKELTGDDFDIDFSHCGGSYCSLCLCCMKYKTASLDSSCGIQKFNEENKTNLDLRWDKKQTTGI